MCGCSAVTNSRTPRAVARQAPLSMGFFRQGDWSGWPCPLPGDLPDPGIKPMSPVSPTLAGGFFTKEPPGKPDEQACEDKYMNYYRCEDSLGALHWRAGLALVTRIHSMSEKGQGTLSSSVCLLWSQRSFSSPPGLECTLSSNLLGWPLGPCTASPLPKG